MNEWEEEINKLIEKELVRQFDETLWLMVKYDHISMGTDEEGEFIFWITKENEEKFQKEQHFYEEA